MRIKGQSVVQVVWVWALQSFTTTQYNTFTLIKITGIVHKAPRFVIARDEGIVVATRATVCDTPRRAAATGDTVSK